MWKMHIVEQEQDRVQSIVLLGLALFASTEVGNVGKRNEYVKSSILSIYKNCRRSKIRNFATCCTSDVTDIDLILICKLMELLILEELRVLHVACLFLY